MTSEIVDTLDRDNIAGDEPTEEALLKLIGKTDSNNPFPAGSLLFKVRAFIVKVSLIVDFTIALALKVGKDMSHA